MKKKCLKCYNCGFCLATPFIALCAKKNRKTSIKKDLNCKSFKKK